MGKGINSGHTHEVKYEQILKEYVLVPYLVF